MKELLHLNPQRHTDPCTFPVSLTRQLIALISQGIGSSSWKEGHFIRILFSLSESVWHITPCTNYTITFMCVNLLGIKMVRVLEP